MDKNLIKSAIDEIKATNEFKKKVYESATDLPLPKVATIKHYRHLIALAATFVLIVSFISVFINYEINPVDKAGGIVGSVDSNIGAGGTGGKVCDMLLSNGKLYYTDYEDKLFCYDSSQNTGKFISNIEITHGAFFFEEDGYAYYSNGMALFKRSLKDNISKQLLSGKNIGVNAVHDGKLFYSIAYKDKSGVYTEFEYHIYELSTGNDTLLFDRSGDMWHLLAVDKNIVILDAHLKNDSGLFSIDLTTGIKKKLLNLRVHEGCIINGKFFYTSQDEKGLWTISTAGDKQHKIPIPGESEENFFVDRITGYGNFLYLAAYSNGNNRIISINLQTYDTTILADGLGRVWKLCTDGKSLYAYDTKSPADMEGQITVIDLK